MRAYVDTGIFIDYLSPSAIAGGKLRSADRRGRQPKKLFEDAEAVLKRIASSHVGATSCLTYYELEEALFKEVQLATKGMTDATVFRVMTARSILTQAVIAVRFFGLQQLALDASIIAAQLNNLELHKQGIRAADSLHIASGINFNADIIISADESIIKLDNLVLNSSGSPVRCCDTDTALTLL